MVCAFYFKDRGGSTGPSADPAFGLAAATNPVPLPEPKPRAVREHIVVPAIRSREIAQAQRSGVRHREDSLKVLDFGDGSVNVHAAQNSDTPSTAY
jgi:hypothetical protein